jgi:hypothetical protein
MLGLAGALMAAALSAWAITAIRRWRRKSPDEIERLRRLDIHRRGRITHGHIVDVVESTFDSTPRTTIVYSYEVAGVSYEVGQDVTALPEVASCAAKLPGHDVLIKHDRKQPANSIAVCEEWSGIGSSGD